MLINEIFAMVKLLIKDTAGNLSLRIERTRNQKLTLGVTPFNHTISS